MDSSLREVFLDVGEKIIGYLPNLVAGLILLAIGWFLGWLAKRVVVQICFLLRIDRVFRRFRWGSGFSKADVRYAFFETVGNIAFFVVFLVLLNAALDALQLDVLSNVLEKGVLFIPRLLIAIIIVILGWVIAGWVANAVQKALTTEDVPRASLLARLARGVTLLFFVAMALVEIDIAREIVIIGFGVTIVTLGVAMVMLTVQGREALTKYLLPTKKKAR